MPRVIKIYVLTLRNLRAAYILSGEVSLNCSPWGGEGARGGRGLGGGGKHSFFLK